MCPFRIDFLFGAICLNFPVNSIIDAINSTSIGKPEYAKARPGKDGGRHTSASGKKRQTKR